MTSDHVAEVVSQATGIPASTLMKGEKQRLLKMEDYLNQHVIGQAQAVSAVSDCIRLARASLHAKARVYVTPNTTISTRCLAEISLIERYSFTGGSRSPLDASGM